MKEENKTGRTKNKKKPLTLYEYLLLVSMIFLFSGFGLFMYVLIGGYDLFKLKWFNDPMLFLGIGFTMLVCCFLQKRYKFFDYLDSLEKN
jgi:hypothetical protein